MKHIFQKKTDGYFLKAVEVESTADELFDRIRNDLSTDELKNYRTFKHIKRKIEWLSSRILLKEMLGEYKRIYYDKHGNPYIQSDDHISITHSKRIVGLIVSKQKHTGIDSEILSERIVRIAHKFIPEETIKNFPKDRLVQYCYLQWCGKETLFKIQGGGGIDFIKHFEIKISELQRSGIIKGIFKKNKPVEHYDISYQFIHIGKNELLLTWY